MRSSGKPAQPARFGRRVVRDRPANEREFVQTLVLAVRPVGRYHFLVVVGRQLQFLPSVSLEYVMSVGTFSLDSAGCKTNAREIYIRPTNEKKSLLTKSSLAEVLTLPRTFRM